ncbi:MAG: phage tail fiber protein, partial [Kiloniellales bacterium]|nr:phage tail fiber protein [Kiloniellales bacterium]
MTVSTTTSRVRYEGDGATRDFPIPFKFVENAHVRVTLRDVASRETLWTEGSEYALSGAGNDGGGTLTVLTEPVDKPPRAGETLVIALDLPFTQDKAFPLGGAFPTTQVEEGLDLAALRDAQLAAFDARALSVPATDAQVGGLELPIDAERAGRYLGFDAQGKPALLAGTAEAADLSDKTVLPTGAAGARSLADLFGLGALSAENVKLHGAKGDTRELVDGTVTDGSAVLSSTSVSFTDADVGKDITVEGAATTGVTITNVEKAPVDNAVQYDSVNLTSVDQTAALNDATAGDVDPFPATEAVGDMFLIGHRAPFSSVTIDIGTLGVGGAVTWKYWDGSAWVALAGVTDGTNGFTAAAGNQTLTFTKPLDWEARR